MKTVRLMNPVRIPGIYSTGKAMFHWNTGAVWRQEAVLSDAQWQLIRLLRSRYLRKTGRNVRRARIKKHFLVRTRLTFPRSIIII